MQLSVRGAAVRVRHRIDKMQAKCAHGPVPTGRSKAELLRGIETDLRVRPEKAGRAYPRYAPPGGPHRRRDGVRTDGLRADRKLVTLNRLRFDPEIAD